jgi:diguanylate cyclase (GGDEF)-like protein
MMRLAQPKFLSRLAAVGSAALRRLTARLAVHGYGRTSAPGKRALDRFRDVIASRPWRFAAASGRMPKRGAANASGRSVAGLRSRASSLADIRERRADHETGVLLRMRSAFSAGGRLFRQPVVGFGVALIVSFWIGAFTLIYQDRAALRFQMQRDAGNLALVFEQNVAHTVSDLDRGLLFLRWARSHTPADVDWPEIVAENFVSNRETAQTSVIDPSGFMVTSSALLRPPAPMYLGDREHFQAQRDSNADKLFISRPVIGRASGKWSVQFSRKLTDREGGFGGVVVVSLDAARLARNYGELNLGPGGGFALVGDDGILRAGSGVFANLIGKTLDTDGRKSTPILKEPSGEVDENSDGLVTADRRVEGAPLKVMVAVPDDENNERWTARRYGYYAGATIASIIAIFATIAVALRRHRSEARILYLAPYDSLTNLSNRRQLGGHLDALFTLPPRERAYALHIIDLDRFKFVNDTYGHPFGDMLLKRVADRLLALARPSDLVVRLGGDEFAIVQSLRFAQSEAQALAQRISREMATPFEIDGVKIIIGATIGIGSASEDANSASELLKAADLALYAAKSEDKGGFRFYDASMTRAVHERTDIENGLRSAIDNEELRLFYQPIVSLIEQRTIGYEALIRWIRPEQGMVAPLDFIPVAEETGLIVKIGDWVLQRACADIAALRTPTRVAVNCSPLQFELSDVAASVQNALARSGLPPERLEIEITESALMKNNQRVADQLRRLSAIGVRVSMDDFGTGFSSLSYLERFPITTIKIDRSFVQKLGEREGARATIRAIIELASSYKMTALAEGVETEGQLQALIALGCVNAQGYLFGKPRPIYEIWQSQAFPPFAPAEAIKGAA